MCGITMSRISMSAISMTRISVTGIPVRCIAVFRSFGGGREVSFYGLCALHDIGERIAVKPGIYDKPDVWHEASEVSLNPRIQIIYDLTES